MFELHLERCSRRYRPREAFIKQQLFRFEVGDSPLIGGDHAGVLRIDDPIQQTLDLIFDLDYFALELGRALLRE
ncbi:hypothetical protein [Parvibaculum sp.]|uniref:hypothetical protein n=1 Tax=Parvibaculum sp. TaxID=2024848 RepID=UPI003296972E